MSASLRAAPAFALAPQTSVVTAEEQLDADPFAFNADAIIHDLCNQIQCAASAVGLLRNRKGSARIEDLGLLLQSARTAIRGADRMLERLCGSRQSPLPATETVDIDDILHDMIPMLRLSAGEDILVTCRSSVQGHKLDCDVHALEASILNIVLNARDAMPDGGLIAITADLVLSAASAEPARTHICLTVHDNGCGMPEHMVEQACDPYVTSKRGGPRRGLGLASVKTFVDASEGWLKIASKPGEGTSVSLNLPAAAA